MPGLGGERVAAGGRPPSGGYPQQPLVGEGGESPESPEQAKPPEKKVLARYYGRVELDPQRVTKEVNLIVDEVLERLTAQLDCQVEVVLEIKARRPEGFDESTVRTISENSRTQVRALRFRGIAATNAGGLFAGTVGRRSGNPLPLD